MKVLITGGAGFIGSWVGTKLVQAGVKVLALDDLSGGYRRNVDGWPLQHVSLTDAEETDRVVKTFRPDIILHTAAYAAEGLSHWMRRYCYTQNLVGWANLANSAIRHGIPRVVALSSMAVYGSQEPPFEETMIPRPEDPYGAAKAAMEVDLKALGEVHGLSWLIVRPHNVMGPRQNLADPYRNVVAIFMRQALSGQPLTVFGDGMQTRAFSYVEDVARAIAELCLSSFTRRIVNVGGEEPITIRQLAQMVIAATGSESEVIHLATRYEVRDAWCRHEVLRELLGSWNPTDTAWGIQQMAEWAKGLEIGRLRQYDYEVTENMFEAWR